MRELTKSLLHCSWALSFFGAHQLGNVVIQRSALQLQEFAEALDNIAEAACRDLSPWELTAYHVGTSIQDRLVELVFQGTGSLSRAMPAGRPGGVWNTAPTEAASWPQAAQRTEMPLPPARKLYPAPMPAPLNDKPLSMTTGA